MRRRARELTLTLCILSIDTRTADHHVMDNSEDTFATDPYTSTVLDLTVVKYRSFIQFNPSAMDHLCKWHFVRVKVLPA